MSTDEIKKEATLILPALQKTFQSEPFVLASIPFFGSYIAFVHESGYLNFFNVPLTFMQLDVVRVFAAIFVVALFFLGWTAFGAFLFTFCLRPHPVIRVLIKPLIMAFISVPVVLLFPQITSYLIAALALFSLFLLSAPLFKRAHGKSYLEKLRDELEIEVQGSGEISNIDKLQLIFLLVALCTVFFFGVGRYEAQTEEVFFIRKSYPDEVLVRVYGDTLIFAKYDQNSLMLSGEISLLTKSESEALVLTPKTTGKLKESNESFSTRAPFFPQFKRKNSL